MPVLTMYLLIVFNIKYSITITILSPLELKKGKLPPCEISIITFICGRLSSKYKQSIAYYKT